MIMFLFIYEDYCQIIYSAINMSENKQNSQSIIHAKYYSIKFTLILVLVINSYKSHSNGNNNINTL